MQSNSGVACMAFSYLRKVALHCHVHALFVLVFVYGGLWFVIWDYQISFSTVTEIANENALE